MKRRNPSLKKMGIVFSLLLVGCNRVQEADEVEEGVESMNEAIIVSINPEEKHQTIESFGASGAWWSQDVGGWTDIEKDGLTKRDYIAQLLFDKEKGIGISSYRYNLGAGSTPENSPKIADPWRRAESFESSPKEYDWSKDANSQWMLNAAIDYGIDDIYFFVNSPLTRLTKNGSAYGEMVDGVSSNLSPENYYAFADYVLDVTEHFVQEGIPVTHVSPINEPQWEWLEGQEGNHYEPDEMVNTLKVFIEEKEKRDSLKDVHLSMPELGEWGESSYNYYDALLSDNTIMNSFDTWEIHSYWTSSLAKEDFILWYNQKDLDVELKMTEWTEMVNGRDYTMDSALNLANQIYEDMTILNVTVWQYWIAVSTYDYRDGLIYVESDTQEISIPKRFWAMGNFSKFVRPGYTRISSTIDDNDINSLSYQGLNEDEKEETISIFINNASEEKSVFLEGEEYTELSVYITDNDNDLTEEVTQNYVIILPPESIVTIVGTK